MQLLFDSKTISSTKATHQVTLTIDDNPPFTYQILNNGSVLSIPLILVIENELRPAKILRAAVDGQLYEFRLPNAAYAIDSVSWCAGMPDHAARQAQSLLTIPDAGDWKLVDKASGAKGCIVRVQGTEVDTSIVLNNVGQVVLTRIMQLGWRM